MMGKPTGLLKPGPSQGNKATKIIKQSDLNKTSATKILRRPKRLLLLQRRVQSLIDEKKSLEDKNKEILENLQAEKMLSASLKKESFHWQRLYHESTITSNPCKVQLAEVARFLRLKEREIDSSYPHLVHLTGFLTNTKSAIRSILSSLPSSDGEFCSGQLHNSEKRSDDLNNKSEKRRKQRVGPMVRGMLITKPKIMLERIMLPQPQQDPVNNNLPAVEENDRLTPIPEENEHEENMHLRHISIRPKRKLGSSWKEKHQEKIDKVRQRNQADNTPISGAYNDEDFSDAESNSPVIEHLEPVVFLRDVSRMFQNTSLLKVDAVHAENNENKVKHFSKQSDKENANHHRHLMRTSDDPLEGSSWMFNTIRQRNFRPSHLKSDSTDEDDDDEIVPPDNLLNTFSVNSYDVNNHSLVVPNKRRRDSLCSETVNTTFHESPAAEPDSTNNIYISPNNSLTETVSTNINICNTTSHVSKSLSQSKSDNSSKDSKDETRLSTCNVTMNFNNSKLSFQRKRSTKGEVINRRSSNNLKDQTSPIDASKRVRKPKIHLYPGEEDEHLDLKKKVSKQQNVSLKKKSLLDNAKVKPNAADRKNSVSKRSLVTPRNSSSAATLSDIRDSKSRRAKKSICYKESPLNVKQRRP